MLQAHFSQSSSGGGGRAFGCSPLCSPLTLTHLLKIMTEPLSSTCSCARSPSYLYSQVNSVSWGGRMGRVSMAARAVRDGMTPCPCLRPHAPHFPHLELVEHFADSVGRLCQHGLDRHPGSEVAVLGQLL